MSVDSAHYRFPSSWWRHAHVRSRMALPVSRTPSSPRLTGLTESRAAAIDHAPAGKCHRALCMPATTLVIVKFCGSETGPNLSYRGEGPPCTVPAHPQFCSGMREGLPPLTFWRRGDVSATRLPSVSSTPSVYWQASAHQHQCPSRDGLFLPKARSFSCQKGWSNC